MFHCYAKILVGELNPDLQANLNGNPSVIYSKSELGLKSHIFMKNDKINSLTNLFQYLLSMQVTN